MLARYAVSTRGNYSHLMQMPASRRRRFGSQDSPWPVAEVTLLFIFSVIPFGTGELYYVTVQYGLRGFNETALRKCVEGKGRRGFIWEKDISR